MMKKVSRFSPVAIGLLMMVFALTGVTQAASTSCGTWHIIASPNPGPGGNGLQAIATLSPTNVWAIGSQVAGGSKGSAVTQTLIEHYNGTGWSVIPSPNVSTSYNALQAIAAVATNDIWAVGYDNASNGSQQTLILHYNGAKWSVFPTTNAGVLSGIAVVSANTIYAVGTGSNGTLIEQYNGTAWQIVRSPNRYPFDVLKAVAVVSANNIYAVGYSANGMGNVVVTLVEHFNGSAWRIISSPNPLPYDSFAALTVVSASNIWAVGAASTPTSADFTLIEHFDGSSWKVIASPNVGTGSNELLSIATLSANNVVAIGTTYISGNSSALIERWNGSSWKLIASPTPPQVQLDGIARILGTSQLWAVGSDSTGTLTETNC
jgi:hypothetical protein